MAAMRVFVSILLAFAVQLAAAQNSTTNPIVDLGYVKYQGVYNTSVDINTFFGIRYAQPPVGELRWQPPQDIVLKNNYSSDQVLDASKEGPICVQGTPKWRSASVVKPIGQEDCLLLDVLVPAHPVSSSLPVMVEIHGGGFTQGDSEYYPGWPLVAQSNGNMILVNIQYRLGAYGFLNSADIRKDGVANAGLLDQRAALNWVQQHIDKFGGDPSRVTINGGSAGGGSVTAQMIMYGGDPNPPFRAVIAEYPWWQSYHNSTILEAQYSQLLGLSNCTDVACLRGLSEDTLAIATQATYYQAYNSSSFQWYGYGDFYYGPSVDGDIIRDLPSNEFKQGHFTKVPLLNTRDGYEGVSFSNSSVKTVAEEQADLQTLFPFAKPSFFNRLFEVYPASDFNSTFFQRQQIFGDFIINCPTYYMATAVSDWGFPVWKMIFDAGSQLHGATHNIIFNNTYGKDPRDNVTMASILKDWFISFTTTLDPNAVSYSNVSKPYWPQYLWAGPPGTGGNFSTIWVNYTDIGTSQDPDSNAQCDFWLGRNEIARN